MPELSLSGYGANYKDRFVHTYRVVERMLNRNNIFIEVDGTGMAYHCWDKDTSKRISGVSSRAEDLIGPAVIYLEDKLGKRIQALQESLNSANNLADSLSMSLNEERTVQVS